MSDLAKLALAVLSLVPEVVEAIQRWADDGNDEGNPIDEEVRRILGPAEGRLEAAIRKAEGGDP
jgi:hypothetical protein